MEGGRIRKPCLMPQPQVLMLDYDIPTKSNVETINYVCIFD
jgi:hypothetical protein